MKPFQDPLCNNETFPIKDTFPWNGTYLCFSSIRITPHHRLIRTKITKTYFRKCLYDRSIRLSISIYFFNYIFVVVIYCWGPHSLISYTPVGALGQTRSSKNLGKEHLIWSHQEAYKVYLYTAAEYSYFWTISYLNKYEHMRTREALVSKSYYKYISILPRVLFEKIMFGKVGI